jgi:hypothetical protein
MKISFAIAISLFSLTGIGLAQSVLFTTTNDFTGWIDAGMTPSATTTVDLDGSNINGLGNGSGAGNIGSAGALTVFRTPGASAEAFSPNEQANSTLLSALANGGIITLMYETVPPANESTLQMMFVWRNNTQGYYGLTPTSTSTSGNHTIAEYQFEGNYFNPFGGSFFEIGIGTFSSYDSSSPIYVDAITFVPAVVPEPGTLSLFGVGAIGFLLICSRRLREQI